MQPGTSVSGKARISITRPSAAGTTGHEPPCSARKIPTQPKAAWLVHPSPVLQSRACRLYTGQALIGSTSIVMSRMSLRIFTWIAMTLRRNSGLNRFNWQVTLDFGPHETARDTMDGNRESGNAFGGME
jgi:hypothetical protein